VAWAPVAEAHAEPAVGEETVSEDCKHIEHRLELSNRSFWNWTGFTVGSMIIALFLIVNNLSWICVAGMISVALVSAVGAVLNIVEAGRLEKSLVESRAQGKCFG
jgi:hypothetical protein